MATTYEPIATTTLGSAAATIDFTSISSAYTDLRLVIVGKYTSAGGNTRITFNSDTASNYSSTRIAGDGTSASSDRLTNQTFQRLNFDGNSTTIPDLLTVDIFSYAGSTFKTSLITSTEDKNGSGSVIRIVGLYRSITAISSITISLSSSTFASGTTATLYGIKAAI
jgi:hypothetical protein